jgi:hypothetical protein
MLLMRVLAGSRTLFRIEAEIFLLFSFILRYIRKDLLFSFTFKKVKIIIHIPFLKNPKKFLKKPILKKEIWENLPKIPVKKELSP